MAVTTILLDGVVIFEAPAPPIPPQVEGRGLRIVFNEELFYPGTGATHPQASLRARTQASIRISGPSFPARCSASPSRAAN
jgi:hypothetical protein